MGVLAAIFVSNLSAALFCFYYISKLTEIKVELDYHLFLESVKFGVIPFLALVVMNMNFKADVFLIKYYLNDTAVGLYTLGVTIVDKITLLPEAIGLILFSRVTNISEGEARKMTPLVCRFSILLSIVIGGVMFATAGFVVPLVYGSEFELSVGPLLILTPGTISLTVYIILHGDLTARGKAKITLYIFAFALVLNILLNLILIPMYGINGAAVASTVSYTIGGVGLVKAFAKINSISFWKLLFPTKEDFREYVVPFVRRVQKRLAYL
jgi:O-antigen/teichoic acid export membrane protein